MNCLRIEIAINSYCHAAVSLFDWRFYLFMSLFVVKCNLSQAGLQTLLCGMSLFIVVVRVTRGMFLSCVLRGYVFHFLFWDGFLFCVRESWRLFVGIVLTCCVRMVLFAFLNSPGSERCLSYVKCRTAFCPLHNGLQVIRHAYTLFYMVGKAGWKGVDGCSVMRNGLYRSAERCLWCGGTVRFGWWERLFHWTEEPFSPSGRAFSGWNDGCDGEAGELLLMCDSV